MYVLACDTYLIWLDFTVIAVFIKKKRWGAVTEDTGVRMKASLEVRRVESVWRRVQEGREWRVWKSQQDRWGLQSLPLPTFICSAHPCMWESVCCRLSQGLSITPFTQSLKFPLLWYAGLPWSSRDPAEVIVVAYSKVSHCFSAVGWLFFFLQQCLSMWAARGAQMAAKNPTSHFKWEVLHNTHYNPLRWSVACKHRSLHISKCSQMY